jgi:hypothetical protein
MANETEAKIKVSVTGDQQAKSKLGSLASFISSKFVITLGDIVAIGKKVLDFFGKASEEASKQEDAIKMLNQALKNQGIYTAEASQALQDYAAIMQATTRYGDDEINNMQALLVSFGLMPDQVNKVSMTVADLATLLKIDLETAGHMVAKTLGSSVNAFARQGIAVDGAVGSMERFDSLINSVSEKAGGQAVSAANTYAGSVERLKNNFGELLELAGGMTNKLFQPFVDGANAVVTSFNKIANATGNYLQGQKLLGEIIKKGTGVVKDYNLEQLENLRTAVLNFKMDQKFTDEYIKAIDERMGAVKKENKAIEEKGIKDKKAKDEAAKNKQDDIDKQKALEDKRKEDEAKKAEEELKQQEADALYLGELQANAAMYNAQQKKQIEAKFNADIAAMTEDTMKNLLNIESGGVREFFEIQKAAATADAIISGYQAVAKAATIAPFPFNIPSITAAGIMAASQVNAIQSSKFAQGGQFETNQATNFSTVGGGQAQVGEKGLERITVEPIGKSQSSGGGSVAPIVIMLGSTELKKIAIDLKPYLNAVDRGVI